MKAGRNRAFLDPTRLAHGTAINNLLPLSIFLLYSVDIIVEGFEYPPVAAYIGYGCRKKLFEEVDDRVTL